MKGPFKMGNVAGIGILDLDNILEFIMIKDVQEKGT